MTKWALFCQTHPAYPSFCVWASEKERRMSDFMLELQKLASENEDVSVTIDENGEVEFEMDEALFIEFIQLQWLQTIERDYN